MDEIGKCCFIEDPFVPRLPTEEIYSTSAK
jgi:hypothetical protein